MRPVDRPEDDPNRNLLFRPPTYELERRSHNTNDMAVICTTQIRLDFATVATGIYQGSGVRSQG